MQMSFIELMDISLAVKRLLYEVNYGYISDICNLSRYKNVEHTTKTEYANSTGSSRQSVATLFVKIVLVLPHNGVIKC